MPMPEDTIPPEQTPDYVALSDSMMENLLPAESDIIATAEVVPEDKENKDPGETPVVEAIPTAETKVVDPATPVDPPVVTDELLAPDTWRGPAKEKWAALDPELKAEVRKREDDIAKFVRETQPAVAVGRRIDEILAPYLPVYKQYNANPYDHIQALLQAHTQMVFGTPEQKKTLFAQLARDAGIDHKTLEVSPADPASDQTRRYVAQLESRIKTLSDQVTGVTARQTESQVAEMANHLAAFAADKVNNPHFEALIPDIKALIDAQAVTTLREAYDIAELRNPRTRALRLDREVATRSATAVAAKKAEAEKAKKLVSVNVRSTGSRRLPPANESIDETLNNTMTDIQSRR